MRAASRFEACGAHRATRGVSRQHSAARQGHATRAATRAAAARGPHSSVPWRAERLARQAVG
eukprot:1900722-Prymnesium_polylepis.1